MTYQANLLIYIITKRIYIFNISHWYTLRNVIGEIKEKLRIKEKNRGYLRVVRKGMCIYA